MLVRFQASNYFGNWALLDVETFFGCAGDANRYATMYLIDHPMTPSTPNKTVNGTGCTFSQTTE